MAGTFWRRMLLPRKTILTLLLVRTAGGVNWLLFVWAVTHDRILATSLGYFINPLVNVVLGFLFLHERLTRIQSLAVLIAACGTIYLTWYLGVAPWIALVLGITFGFYGLVRKKLGVGPMIGLLWETLLWITPALLYFAWTMSKGSLQFMHGSLQLDLLLLLAGLVTVLPLIGFNIAAQNLSLTTVGFFQYLAPSISFVLAVFFYNEPFTRGHAVAFSCIWLALIMVSIESVVRPRRIKALLQPFTLKFLVSGPMTAISGKAVATKRRGGDTRSRPVVWILGAAGFEPPLEPGRVQYPSFYLPRDFGFSWRSCRQPV